MKKLFILVVVGLAIALMLSFAITLDPGYVRISVGNWLIESNLWVMSAIYLFAILLLMVMLSFVRGLVKNRHFMSRWLGSSSSKRARQKTEKGLIALLEGNWSSANKLLSKSAEKSDTPLINYVGAARAANELGDAKSAEQLLKAAYDKSSSSQFAVGIAQAQIQLEQNQLEQCLATLLRLKKQQPNHPFVLKLLKTVYLRLEDWHQLVKIIPLLRKAPRADKETIKGLEQRAWNKIFIQKATELQRAESHKADNKQKENAAEQLSQLWKQVPDSLRFDDQLIETYARQLSTLGYDVESESLLRKILSKHWSDTLVSLYGLVQGKNASEQLITAENWLTERPNNAVLLLTLGRLALRNALWGKALEYFEASNRLQPNQQSCAELYRLSIKMNEDKSRQQQLLNGIIQSLKLPDLPLP